MVAMRFVTTITGYTTNIFNAHTTGKESHCQKEAYDQHRDGHQNPCDGFQATVAQHLEDAGTEETDHNPPDHCTHITGQ
jgi:hypothetical protein